MVFPVRAFSCYPHRLVVNQQRSFFSFFFSYYFSIVVHGCRRQSVSQSVVEKTTSSVSRYYNNEAVFKFVFVHAWEVKRGSSISVLALE